NVPSQFRAKIAEYVEGYELYDHVLQAGRNPARMAELGLTEYALERFALAGNVNDWCQPTSGTGPFSTLRTGPPVQVLSPQARCWGGLSR
ncbi:MAG TPA: hypothetical protein VF098_08625, partial [Sphingomicrobium sp.]